MSEKVVQCLLGRVPPMQAATLNGYHRYCIRNRVYPAIYPTHSAFVLGKLLREITQQEKEILDKFEDDEYSCESVYVDLGKEASQVERAQAFTYVWHKSREELTGTWSYNNFEKDHLDSFLKMTKGFSEGFHQRIPF